MGKLLLTESIGWMMISFTSQTGSLKITLSLKIKPVKQS